MYCPYGNLPLELENGWFYCICNICKWKAYIKELVPLNLTHENEEFWKNLAHKKTIIDKINFNNMYKIEDLLSE